MWFAPVLVGAKLAGNRYFFKCRFGPIGRSTDQNLIIDPSKFMMEKLHALTE
jgi:hypothetical protein